MGQIPDSLRFPQNPPGSEASTGTRTAVGTVVAVDPHGAVVRAQELEDSLS